jgi:hypothetical protein
VDRENGIPYEFNDLPDITYYEVKKDNKYGFTDLDSVMAFAEKTFVPSTAQNKFYFFPERSQYTENHIGNFYYRNKKLLMSFGTAGKTGDWLLDTVRIMQQDGDYLMLGVQYQSTGALPYEIYWHYKWDDTAKAWKFWSDMWGG